jgi:hypothetical protein
MASGLSPQATNNKDISNIEAAARAVDFLKVMIATLN